MYTVPIFFRFFFFTKSNDVLLLAAAGDAAPTFKQHWVNLWLARLIAEELTSVVVVFLLHKTTLNKYPATTMRCPMPIQYNYANVTDNRHEITLRVSWDVDYILLDQ